MKHMILVAITMLTLSLSYAAMAQSFDHEAPPAGAHAVNNR
jgi:hypothetical protein